jgi:hypothetical protein
MLPSQRQHALAAAHAEDEAPLGKHDGDRSGFRVQCRADSRHPRDCQQGNQARFPHDFFSKGLGAGSHLLGSSQIRTLPVGGLGVLTCIPLDLRDSGRAIVIRSGRSSL